MASTIYEVLCSSGATSEQCSVVWSGVSALATVLACLLALVAGRIAWLAWRTQLGEVRTSLWKAMDDEFAYNLSESRYMFSVAWLAKSEKTPLGFEECQNVMDFFETIGYLVRNGRIDEELAHHSFSYFFEGYYQGAEKLIGSERCKNKDFYKEIEYLHAKWGAESALTSDSDLRNFFNTEMLVNKKNYNPL